jgi:hypothetical protein
MHLTALEQFSITMLGLFIIEIIFRPRLSYANNKLLLWYNNYRQKKRDYIIIFYS